MCTRLSRTSKICYRFHALLRLLFWCPTHPPLILGEFFLASQYYPCSLDHLGVCLRHLLRRWHTNMWLCNWIFDICKNSCKVDKRESTVNRYLKEGNRWPLCEDVQIKPKNHKQMVYTYGVGWWGNLKLVGRNGQSSKIS